MNSRISTNQVFNQTLQTMFTRQVSQAKLQEQMATGSKLVTAKDDPVASGVAVGLDRALAELERHGANANTLSNRLGLQENSLSQAGGIMGRIHELTVRANSASLSEVDRQSIAKEMSSLRDSLLEIANSADGSGRYLFGGSADGSAPFARSGGVVVYSGDQVQRQVEVAPEMRVADTQPGSEIFLRVRTGDGRVDAAADPANTGSGLVKQYGVLDSNAWSGEGYTVRFIAEDAWELLDAAGDPVVDPISGDPVVGAFSPGDTLTFEGLKLQIDGQPAAGDGFGIERAGTRDVFATIDRLIGALESAPTTDAQKTQRQNLLQSSLRDIATAQEHMIDARAAGGAQLGALETAANLRDSQGITIQTTLSGLRDLDYAEAISRFMLDKTALEAAQSVFMQTQRTSLFDFLR